MYNAINILLACGLLIYVGTFLYRTVQIWRSLLPVDTIHKLFEVVRISKRFFGFHTLMLFVLSISLPCLKAVLMLAGQFKPGVLTYIVMGNGENHLVDVFGYFGSLLALLLPLALYNYIKHIHYEQMLIALSNAKLLQSS